MRHLVACSLAVATLVTAAPALAQNPDLFANYGAVSLNVYFPNDPYRIELAAGGPVDVGPVGGNCVGFVSDAPSFELTYTPGEPPLIISVMPRDPDDDMVLVINDPAGNWVCNDDYDDGKNPLLAFQQPLAGTYDIWVGTYELNAEQPATLAISERATAWGDPLPSADNRGPRLDRIEDPTEALMYATEALGYPVYEPVALASPLQPDPYSLIIEAGGERPADILATPDCAGNITPQPTLTFHYTPGAGPLFITSYSVIDTTLAVLDPSGSWHCNDDAFGHDPLLRFDAPAKGVFAIWVGVFEDRPTADARLEISERTDLR